MATKPLNIDTKRLPTTPQWSPILSHSSLSSPRSSTSSAELDLSSRCRKLARSFGESALADDFEHPGSSPSSPQRSRENSNEGLAPPASPLSGGSAGGQRHHHHLPLSPPLATPEGSHVLNEILEEESEATPPKESYQSDEKGLGFSHVEGSADENEPIQFKLSPVTGSQMSLHGASLAMEGLGSMGTMSTGEGALGLSLHERLKIDNEDYNAPGEENTGALRDQLKTAKGWIGVDVCLVDGELLVGKPDSKMDPSRTFSTCFVDPLLEILAESSPASPSSLFAFHDRRLSSPPSSPTSGPSPSRCQPLPASHPDGLPTISSPLYLAVTLHTSLPLTLQYLQASLQPLHDRHFLTSYCPNARLTSKGAIVILVTGSDVTDHDLERQLETPRIVYRSITFDEARDQARSVQSHPVITTDLSDFINTSTGASNGRLSEESKSEMANQVKRAHEAHFAVAVRGVPRFPEHVRKSLEADLTAIGVDFVA